jgi:hypothetical protein
MCGTNGIVERCSTALEATPNLACLTNPVSPPCGPATVTVTGIVEVFSSGPSSDGVTVGVYDGGAIDAASTLDLAAPIGAPFTTQLNSTSVQTARACRTTLDNQLICQMPTADCGTQCPPVVNATQYCYQGVCQTGFLRWELPYTITGIPTNRFLAIRTNGPGGAQDPTWGQLVQYNVYLSTADPSCDATHTTNCFVAGASTPTYRLNINALSRGDYENIPTTAGLNGGIPAGHGAIAGEVDDCDDVRVSGAQVGTNPQSTTLTYFNGDPANTLPSVGRTPQGTDVDGLYAALDLVPGPVTVRAAGEVAGSTVDLGSFKAKIWPDSVSIIPINSGHPPQP